MRCPMIAAVLLVPLVLGACTPDIEPPKPGAEPNTTDPRWVVQHAPAADVAVVFVHGIFGDTIGTWTSDTTSFFRLLSDNAEIGPKVDMFAFGFTSKMMSAGSFTIQEAANRLHERLTFHHVLDYPAIVFVAHSMGGLVTLRELLTHRELIPRVPLIVFYATPQEGAQITAIARHLSGNPALAEMLPADSNSYLQAMNDEWKEATRTGGPPIVCGYEKLPTYGVTIVPWASATRFCTGAAVAIDASHVTIVKPDRPEHDSIVLLVNALNEFVVGRQFVAKLELPDFVRDGDRWTYTLRAAVGKQPARIVNAGRAPLRYTIGELSDPGLYIWPDDTPKTLPGESTGNLKFALAREARAAEYRFVLRSDADGDQPITVSVPDLAQVHAEQAALLRTVIDDVNTWLSSTDEQQALAATAVDDPAVAQRLLEQARQSVARALPDTPESLQWVLTAEAMRAVNWSTLAVEALRNAEKSSPAVVRNPGVQRLATESAAAAGESRVFESFEIPMSQFGPVTTTPSGLPEGIDPVTASELAGRLRVVPALRASGLSLEGDVQRSRGDSEAARRAYEEAAQIRLTPALAGQIRELPSPPATGAGGVPGAATVPARGLDRRIVVGSEVSSTRSP